MEASGGADTARSAEHVSLSELFKVLYKNGDMAESTIDAIEYHAASMGEEVCGSFLTLNEILMRHESLIRQRWGRKSVAQRRAVLLDAWPDMTQDEYSASRKYIISHVNLDQLTKPKNLLVFLNARGRNLPWTFARSEEAVDLMARMTPCRDESFCKSTTVVFTESPNPATYGKINRGRDPEQHYHVADDTFELCARSSCVQKILHDIPWENIHDAPNQEEPALSTILMEDYNGHTRFSDVLKMAPYRGWHSLNFSRLRNYVYPTLNIHKKHIRALREDPSYFADTILEYEQHAPFMSRQSINCPYQECDLYTYQAMSLKLILDEAVSMFVSWTELDRRLVEFDHLCCENANMVDQVHALDELEDVAKWMLRCLLPRLLRAFDGAPGVRKLKHQNFDPNLEEQSLYLKQNSPSTQHSVCNYFQTFSKPNEMIEDPSALVLVLQRIDDHIQKHDEVRNMMSGRVLNLLTDVSILGECLRQNKLWHFSPKTMYSCRVDHKDCNYDYDDSRVKSILKPWGTNIESWKPILQWIFPVTAKLNYPSYKRRTRSTIDTMRNAEASLDKFWHSLDEFLEQHSASALLKIIKDNLAEDGDLERTEPWTAPEISKPGTTSSSEPDYVPIPLISHDVSLQITGHFDKLSVEEKTKIKTRGIANPTVEVNEVPDEAPFVAPTEGTFRTFTMDKRTHKVFKSLFHIPLDELGDASRVIKWDDFKRAMARVGFAVEKLPGCAWKFTPTQAMGLDVKRGINFNEPHPDGEIPYNMARRFGRRLSRAYGWSGATFNLA